MPPNLLQAIRAATRMTRDQDPVGATRIIREALAGSAVTPQNDRQPATSPQAARLLEPPETAAGPGAEVGSTRPFSPGIRRPLGEVVNALRGLRRSGAAQPATAGSAQTTPVAIPAQATFEWRTFRSAAGTRAFRLYVPGRRAPYAGLVVMLHGCTQDPDDFASGTGMNALAEEHGLLVAYPAQTRSANAQLCWNWFDPKDQRRDTGEPAVLAGITRAVMAEFALDRAFVAGLSAGGAMAAILGETHPDVYEAIGVHSGLPAGAARDVVSAFSAMRGDAAGRGRGAAPRPGSAGRRVRTIVFHGDDDPTVNIANGKAIAAAAHAGHGGTGEAESGRASGGRSYSRTVVRNPDGPSAVEYWTLHGGGHAWSGGSADGTYTDPSGPDASRAMVAFFLA